MTALTARRRPACPSCIRCPSTLPPELEAPAPPETRGMTRDAVRMLVAHRRDLLAGALALLRAAPLPRRGRPGRDQHLGHAGGRGRRHRSRRRRPVQVHLSTQLPAGLWTVELRRDGAAHLVPGRATSSTLPGGGPGRAAHPLLPRPGRRRACASGSPRSTRPGRCTATWPATAGPSATATCRAASRSRPTRTSTPPSPVRPRCRAPGAPSPPRCSPAWWPRASAWPRCSCTPAWPRSRPTSRPTPSTSGCRCPRRTASTTPGAPGGRVIAIGTTVVRALESVVDEHGHVHPSEGWTETVVTPERPGAFHRRLPHRLARARGLAPGHARGHRRPARSSRPPTRPPWPRATCGTSSATST